LGFAAVRFVCVGSPLLHQWQGKSAHPPLTLHACNHIKVRLGEKEALDSFLGWLEARQGEFKSLQYYQERRLKRLGLMDEEGRTTYDSFFKDGIA